MSAQSVSTPQLPSQATPKQPKIAEDALIVYTKEAYPKLYAKVGAAGLDAITTHDTNAAITVANLPECDSVEVVSYSERTNYPTQIVSFVDCANQNRFYVSNGQVIEKTNTGRQSPQASQAQPSIQSGDPIKSESIPMNFSACVALQQQSVSAVFGAGYKTSVIVDTNELRMVRICTNDGSVLITCSEPDGNMITTTSPHCP